MILIDDGLYTVEQVAQYLHCHPEHIRRLARKRKIGHFRNGKRFLFNKSQIQRYLQSREIRVRAF